jgi:hypothetical protein
MRLILGAASFAGRLLSVSSPQEISAMLTTETLPAVQLDLVPRSPVPNSYLVYFRSEIQYGWREIVADTPEQALRLARRFLSESPEDLRLDYYETGDIEINEIEVCDGEYNRLIQWYDDEMRLRLAARDLLKAAEEVIATWERGDFAEAVRDLSDAVAKAKGGVA